MASDNMYVCVWVEGGHRKDHTNYRKTHPKLLYDVLLPLLQDTLTALNPVYRVSSIATRPFFAK